MYPEPCVSCSTVVDEVIGWGVAPFNATSSAGSTESESLLDRLGGGLSCNGGECADPTFGLGHEKVTGDLVPAAGCRAGSAAPSAASSTCGVGVDTLLCLLPGHCGGDGGECVRSDPLVGNINSRYAVRYLFHVLYAPGLIPPTDE